MLPAFLVTRGFSYRGHAAMPSVKWAIAIEKEKTTTARKPRFYFAASPTSRKKSAATSETSGVR